MHCSSPAVAFSGTYIFCSFVPLLPFPPPFDAEPVRLEVCGLLELDVNSDDDDGVSCDWRLHASIIQS